MTGLPASPAALRLPRPSVGLDGPRAAAVARGLLILLLIAVALLGVRPIADGDVWWHLKTGEYFFQHRSFPERDPFLFTAGSDRWIIRAWLTEVVFYLVYRAGGPAGLTLFKTALFVLAVGILWRLGAAAGCPPPLAALALLLAALTASPRLAERPETVSFLLLAAGLAILMRSGAGRGAYLLVPLQVLWANVHSSFLLGLALPWPFVLDAAARRSRAAGEAGSARHLAAAALLLWPASALTPEGIRLVLYPLHLARMPTVALIDEVRDLVTIMGACAPCLEEAVAFGVLAAGALAICVLQAGRRSTPGPGTWLLALGAAAVPFFVYRLLPYSGLILATVVLRGAAALLSGGAVAPQRPSLPGRRQVLAVGGAALLLVFVTVNTVRGARFPFGLGVARDIFPQGAARFILRAAPRGPLFNSLEFGSYLLWALYPRQRVFIHSAIWDSLADDRLVARFLRSARDPQIFDELVGEYGIELLVLPNGLPAWSFVRDDGRWALVFWDQVASVYVRRDGANGGMVATHEFRSTRYDTDLTYLRLTARDPARQEAAAAELRRAVRDDPCNMAAALSLAFLLKSARRDLEEALAAVEAWERYGIRDETLLAWKAEIQRTLAARPGPSLALRTEARPGVCMPQSLP